MPVNRLNIILKAECNEDGNREDTLVYNNNITITSNISVYVI